MPYAYIRNNYIMQRLKDFRLVPEYRQTNSQGERVPGVVYLSFSYRVIKAGRLKIEFVGADKTGFENFNMFGHEEDLPVGGEKMFTLDGLWNGTGDFKLSFTGVIYISLLVFSTNKADALAYKYRTLFEQSERLVKISAAVFDKDGEALKETGLVIKPEGSGLYAQDSTGKVALIGVSVEGTGADGGSVSKIKLTGDEIILEGRSPPTDISKYSRMEASKPGMPRFTEPYMPMTGRSVALHLTTGGCTGKPVTISAMTRAA